MISFRKINFEEDRDKIVLISGGIFIVQKEGTTKS